MVEADWKYELTVTEVEGWSEKFPVGEWNTLRTRPEEEDFVTIAFSEVGLDPHSYVIQGHELFRQAKIRRSAQINHGFCLDGKLAGEWETAYEK